MGLLDGRVTPITGGARGQGRAHAVTSAREGAEVIPDATVRHVEALNRRAASAIADPHPQEQLGAAITRGIAELGQLNIIIGNAGFWTQAPFWELSEQSSKEMIVANLNEVWTSTSGLEPGMNDTHHDAAKHGIIGLMKIIDRGYYLHALEARGFLADTARYLNSYFAAASTVDAGHLLLTGVNQAPVR